MIIRKNKTTYSVLAIVFISFTLIFQGVRGVTNPIIILVRPGYYASYSWDFSGFPEIYTTNGTRVNYTDPGVVTIKTVNPTSAEFNISYSVYGDFAEEKTVGIMRNSTHTQEYYVSMLLDPNLMKYVDSEGVPTQAGVIGYMFIDFNEAPYNSNPNLVIGTQYNVGGINMNITALIYKPVLVNPITTDLGEYYPKYVWRLENNSERMNLTYHYDFKKGILINAEVRLNTGFIGSGANLDDTVPEFIGHNQSLVATNIWDDENNETTDSSTTDSGTTDDQTTNNQTNTPVFITIIALATILVYKKKR